MIRRFCKSTGNECGTDTWIEGYVCPCSECGEYMLDKLWSAAGVPAPIPESIRPTPKRSRS